MNKANNWFWPIAGLLFVSAVVAGRLAKSGEGWSASHPR